MVKTHDGAGMLGGKAEAPQSPDEADARPGAQIRTRTWIMSRASPAGIHLALPGHRPARFRPSGDRLCSRQISRRDQSRLKLYLTSFRNHGAFHEACTIRIAKDLVAALEPRWLRIGGYWYPRGGMPIDVFYQTGEPPKGLWLPDQGVAPYRGRG